MEHELLPLVLFAFVHTLDLKCKLAHRLVRIVKPSFQTCNVLLELADILLQEKRLPDKFKEWLQHGG